MLSSRFVVLWFDRGDSAPRLRLSNSYSDEFVSSSIIPKRSGGGRGRIFFRRRPANGESGIDESGFFSSVKWLKFGDGILWRRENSKVIGAVMGITEEIMVIVCDAGDERREIPVDEPPNHQYSSFSSTGGWRCVLGQSLGVTAMKYFRNNKMYNERITDN